MADKTEVGKVTLTATASKTWTTGEDEATVMVSVQPPLGNSATPSDICCVVDVSGSMGSEATVQNEKGDTEVHGLSILDVVKHAVRTIVNILKPTDHLSLVVYSSKAKKIFDLIPMDALGKAKAEKEISSLDPDGNTNLWDGLLTGLEVLRTSSGKGRLGSLLLLTDGQPNEIPPEGHIPALQKYIDKNGLSCSINTFGFGYSMDSELLKELATHGNGMYAFIPDSGFVGTTFVNATSNILASMAKNATLSLEPLNGASIPDGGVLGISSQSTSWGALVNLGFLLYEQNRNIVLRLKIPKDSPKDKPYLQATLKYETIDSAKPLECTIEAKVWDASLDLEVEAQRHRVTAINCIKSAMQLMGSNKISEASKTILNLVTEIKGSASAKSDKRVQELLKDLEGQVTEAFSKYDFYSKWGKHYLPSLVNAHQLQICNNFKDPGVQLYGGKIFSQIRDLADDIFVKLPPPVPSIKHYGSTNTAPVSMSTYYCSGNPCFHGDCVTRMADGSYQKVRFISKGDQVMTPSGKAAEVICVVKTLCVRGVAELVELQGGLVITPYHPVRLEGKWHFPCSLGEIKKRPCDAVYSFVLRGDPIMVINEVPCVTLGHNFQEDVVKHPYFGSQRIIEDLKKMYGWNSGLILLEQGCVIRDSKTGLICGLRQSLIIPKQAKCNFEQDALNCRCQPILIQ